MPKQRIDQPRTTPEVSQSLEVRASINNRLAANQRRCVIKKHRATSLHYDFRFVHSGALLSWVLRNGPSLRSGECRVAVQVDDHDPEYMASERVIPLGQYGAGPVMLWDEGILILLPGYEDVPECLRNGCLRFTLDCHKLRGRWILRRRSKACRGGRREVWELIKEADQFARDEGAPDILVEAPNSVSTGRTLEEIEQDADRSTAKCPPLHQLVLIFSFEP
jgi:bifunctional non-homologous end joining protein LigD